LERIFVTGQVNVLIPPFLSHETGSDLDSAHLRKAMRLDVKLKQVGALCTIPKLCVPCI